MKIVIKLFCSLAFILALLSCSKDDEPTAALPTISISDATAFEGSELLFTVSVNTTSLETITFNYKTEDGTATTSDYHAVASNLIGVILPGETSVTITIPTKTDGITESDETMKLVLSDPKNATITDGEGIGTIKNKAGTTVTYFMKAKLNGIQWTAKIGGFFGAEFINNVFPGYGTDNNSQLSFVFYTKPTGAKTYGLQATSSTNDATVSAYYSPTFFSDGGGGPTWYSQPGGEFKIVSYDLTTKIAEGTFSFSVKNNDGNVIQITEGSFKVPISN